VQASQNANEPLEELSDRVRKLASRAFKELPEKYANRKTIVRFCEGLYDMKDLYEGFKQTGVVLEGRSSTLEFDGRQSNEPMISSQQKGQSIVEKMSKEERQLAK
jgi:hypothetical protein